MSVASAGTIVISQDGTGDLRCDGTDDQVQINQALAYAATNTSTTIYLKGSAIYTITEPLNIYSNTIITGDNTAKLKTGNNLGWAEWTPLIKQSTNSISNIEICGFEIDGHQITSGGDSIDSSTGVPTGDGYYVFLQVANAMNVSVHDMYMHHGSSDFVRATNCNGVQYYNNTVYLPGHEGLYAVRSANVEAWNNKITARCNAGLRIWDSYNVSYHDNIIGRSPSYSTGPGIQIEKSLSTPMNNIQIYNNTIYNIIGPGIWIIAYGDAETTKDSDSLHIHHNVIYNCGLHQSINWVGGIVGCGWDNLEIDNNVFDHNHGFGIYIYPAFTGITPPDSGYVISVHNNAITNTVRRTLASTSSGYGVDNTLYNTHTVTMVNNVLYNNIAGDYNHVASSTDINADPKYTNVSALNFKLLPGSPAIGKVDVVGYHGNVDGVGFTDVITPNNTQDYRPNIGETYMMGFVGVVYNTDTSNPIRGAVVTIWNGSWSNTTISDNNGYFEFVGTPGNGVYYIRASATDYQTSPDPLPVNLVTSEYTTFNIALTKSPSYFTPHYATFTVMDIFGNRYENVSAKVYRVDNYTTPEFSGYTDVRGSVTFSLNETATYRIVIRDDNQNINLTKIIIPRETSYILRVWDAHKTNKINNISPTNVSNEHIQYICTANAHNLTHYSINVSMISRDDNVSITKYNTTVTQIYPTNGTIVRINNSTIISYRNYMQGSGNASLIFYVPKNAMYEVNSWVSIPSYNNGTSTYYYKVFTVGGADIREGYRWFDWENQWNYTVFAYCLMLLAGGLSSRRNVNTGAITVMMFGLFGWYTGWIQYSLGDQIMAMFGCLIVVVYILGNRDNR